MEAIYLFKAGDKFGTSYDNFALKDVEIVSINYKSLSASVSPEIGNNKVTITPTTGPTANTDIIIDLGTSNPTSLGELYELLNRKLTGYLSFNAKNLTFTNVNPQNLLIKAEASFRKLIGLGSTAVISVAANNDHTLEFPVFYHSPTFKFQSGNVTILLLASEYGKNALFYPNRPIEGTLGTRCKLITKMDDLNQTVEHSYPTDFTLTLIYRKKN